MPPVAHDESLAPELTPPWHALAVAPHVEHKLQFKFRGESLRQLHAVTASDHKCAFIAVLLCPAIHLARAGPTPASRGVQVQHEWLAGLEKIFEVHRLSLLARGTGLRVRRHLADEIDGRLDQHRHGAGEGGDGAVSQRALLAG